MKLVTRLKLLLFIAASVLTFSFLPFSGTYLDAVGKWALLPIIAWHLSAKVTRYLLGYLVSPVSPQSKWVLVSSEYTVRSSPPAC